LQRETLSVSATNGPLANVLQRNFDGLRLVDADTQREISVGVPQGPVRIFFVRNHGKFNCLRFGDRAAPAKRPPYIGDLTK
jgi:hypothetical protein